MSPGDRVTNVVFEQDPWPAPSKRIRNVTFNGVAISKTTVKEMTFADCTFEDCLFVGTRFEEVEFHNCKFVNCNFWKARFQHVYLDPNRIIFDRRFRIEASNIGISLYQALLGNFAEERQDKFYMDADILFRRWKRHQIGHDLRRKRLGQFRARTQYVSSLFYEIVAGFGYRPGRFFLVTIFLFMLISWLNYHLIGNAVAIDGTPSEHASFANTMFYSFSILTVLGFSSIVPVGAFAKLLTVFEALAGVGWLGMLSAVLVKRFLR
jgi:hypothetical protein